MQLSRHFPQISRSGIPDFPRWKHCKIKESENKCDFSLSIYKLRVYLVRVTMITKNKRGAVTIALGQEGLAKLRLAAKLTKHKPAAVAKALIFSGIDSVLSGELKIETKPRITKP